MAFPIVNTRRRNLPGGAADLILSGADTFAGGLRRHRDEKRAERLAGEERDFSELQRKKDRAHQLAMTNVGHINALERSRLETEARGEQSREIAEFNAATQRQLLELRLDADSEVRRDRLGLDRERLGIDRDRLGLERERLDRAGEGSGINPIDVIKMVTGGLPFVEEEHGEAVRRLMNVLSLPPGSTLPTPGGGGGRDPVVHLPPMTARPPDRRTPPPTPPQGLTPPPTGRSDALGAGPAGGLAPDTGPGLPAGVESLDPAEIAEDLIQLVPPERLEAEVAKLPPGIREQVLLEIRRKGGGR